MSKTTIIVPVWGHLKYTKEFINSLYSATPHEEFDLIIVDNASKDVVDENGKKDKTPKYLKKIVEVYKNIHVITNSSNEGYIGGINAGLRLIDTWDKKPEFIIYGNNDVTFTEDWLPKMKHWFNEYENLGALGPISNNVAGPQHMRWNVNFGDSFQPNAKYLIGFWMMVRYKVYEQVGKLDDAFGLGFSDDLDYSIRIKDKPYNNEANWVLGVARDVVIYHEGSASYRDFHKTEQEYKDDLEKKQAILEKKWGKDRVKDLMDITYYHGTVVFPTKEFVATPFVFSIIRLFNETRLKLKFYNGKSTMPIKAYNEGLKQEAEGEWTLLLSDQMYFGADIVDKCKEIAQKEKVEVVLIQWKGKREGYAGAFVMNSVIEKFKEPYFMLQLEGTSFDWFIGMLNKQKIPYVESAYMGVKHEFDMIEEEKVFISSPHKEYDLTIGIPCIENVHNTFVASMLSHLYRNTKPTKIVMTYRTQVDRARNTIVEHLEGHYLWFIDSDQTFNPQVLDHMLQLKEPIVTAVVYKKNPPYSPCVYGVNPEKYGYVPVYFPFQKRHYLVDMCGTGCVIIHREVFDKLKKPYFWYNEKQGEDVYFFEKVREAGVRIVADSALPIGHTTLKEIGAIDFMEHNFPDQADKLQINNIT